MDNNKLHIFADPGEVLAQRSRRTGVLRNNTGPAPERRSTISSMSSCSYQNTRMRNLSGGSSGSSSTTSAASSNGGSSTHLSSDNQYSDNLTGFPVEVTPFANNSMSTVPASTPRAANLSTSSHRKLDRCWSDTDNDRTGSHRSVNSSRYKTELCRPFEESGSCKYGDKCQFAHGSMELRNLARHPKYKTELCRTFHTVGFCPYGPRCHFIHEEDTKPGDASPKLGRSGSVNSSGSSSPSLSPSGSDEFNNVFSYQNENRQQVATLNAENRQVSALTVNINNYGSSNFDLQVLEKHFSTALNLNRSSSNNSSSSIINDNVFSANTNNNKEPKLIGTEERDIFSEVTMFNSADVLDNAPKTAPTSCALQATKLDNFPSFVDTAYWQSSYGENYYSQIMRPMDFSHSPTGSDGSSSDSGGSTESLTSMLFTEWRSPVAVGQY